jgi:hypothetical protein
MNVVEQVGHETLGQHLWIYGFSMFDSGSCRDCQVGRRWARGVIDCEVSNGLKPAIGKHLEVVRAKVSYRVAIRVADYYAQQNEIDSDL